MHGFRSTFRVVEADLNARRTDYTIGLVHEVAIGKISPAPLDYLEQNVSIEMTRMNISPAGSESSDGPIGYGHYYAQADDFTITLYSADPRQELRIDTFGDGFLFVARARDQYNRRRVFMRSKIKSSVIVPNLARSSWLDQLSENTPNGFVDIDLWANQDIHFYLNENVFFPNMYGDMIIYYSDINEDGSLAGFNGNYGGIPSIGTGTGGTGDDSFDNDPRFNIPPAAIPPDTQS